jgi:hypothetical protein
LQIDRHQRRVARKRTGEPMRATAARDHARGDMRRNIPQNLASVTLYLPAGT